jgi:hypothetical protein
MHGEKEPFARFTPKPELPLMKRAFVSLASHLR